MTTKVIYPILIIIFSILIIFAIINNKNNNKLNIGVENFVNEFLSQESLEYNIDDNNEYLNEESLQYDFVSNNQYLNKRKESLKSNVEKNTENTQNIANGDWTYYNTTIDPKTKLVSNLINIDITNINNINNNRNTNNNYEFGTITIKDDVYNIIMVLNENVTGVLSNNSSKSIHIKFYNIYGKEGKINLNNKYSNPQTYQSEVSIYNGNKLINKFVSYKVFNNYASDELFRIIKENNHYISKPPPLYDIIPYNIITGGLYKFPGNYISFGNENVNVKSNIIDILKNKYFGQIQFSIIRVFYSPSGNEIRTQNSEPLLLKIPTLKNNPPTVPNYLNVLPFVEDQKTNKLNSFFKPKATLLYFFKAIKVDTTYLFADKYKKIKTQESTLNLNTQNNSLNNLYKPNIQYNNLETIKQVNNNIFEITYFGSKDSNLNDNTIFDFTSILNKL